MKTLSQAAQSLWAKKSNNEGSLLWLPLTTHMQDSALTAQKLWNYWLSEGVKQAIAAGMTEKDGAEQLFVFLAASHDLGKATPVFQAKQTRPLCRELDEQIEEKMRMAGLPIKSHRDFISAGKTPHALATQVLLEHTGCNRNVASILGAHHGKPTSINALFQSSIGAYKFNYHLEEAGKETWTAVQQELIDFALEIAGINSISEIPIPNMTAQVLLSGLLIMTDWIASNEEYYPYIRPEDASYYYDTEYRLKTAWDRFALPCPWKAGNAWMNSDLYQERFTFTPNTLQSTLLQTARNIQNPGIIVIEAPMGTGKTEGALACAEIFADKTKRGGVFFALPTQATSDGIFPRLRNWAEKLDEYGGYSINLAHGKAQFNEDFQTLKFIEGSTNIGYDDENLIVHEWFEGQKKTMLADFVVGTIDQLLLAALKQKHVMLRHLGLAGKVVVIDECHAYDAYMGQYLNRALNWLGAYDVPVIVLSATLPAQKRQAVIDAYLNKSSTPKPQRDPLRKSLQDQCQSHPQEWIQSREYPLITYTDGGQINNQPVPADGYYREVHLAFLSEEALADKLEELLVEGGCAGVLVNTVKRAQEFAQLLCSRFGSETVLLLHSRFLASERAKKEDKLLKELGKPDKGRKRPEKRIVVGTQVLEQSLDIDFDVLITDICPMDLLLQRVGRLHRHERPRPEKLIKTHCLIMGCSNNDFEAGTKKIYGSYLLMRTKAFLPERLVLPRDIPYLVQDTYNDSIDISPEPPGYQQAKNEQKKIIIDKETRAEGFCLRAIWQELTQNLTGLLNKDVTDKQGEATVRDTAESMEILLVQEKGDGRLCFLPWVEEGRELPLHEMPDELAQALARQRIRLPTILSAPWAIDKTILELERMNSKLFSEWQKSPWLRGELFLVLDKSYAANLCGYRLTYNQYFGLLSEKEDDVDDGC